MEKLKQKISEKIYLPIRQGSILAYSLIIMSVMLLIAVGISSVSIIEKKSASTTGSSTQTLQTADSGIKLAIKKIGSATGTDLVSDVFNTSCNIGTGDIIMSTSDTGLPGDITLKFFKSDGTTQVACNEAIDQIENIKSIGEYENTTRAVQVALAAGYSSPIICKHHVQTYGSSYNTVVRLYGVSFKAEDCGGTLPDTNYVGVVRRIQNCGGMIAFRVLDSGEIDETYTGPGLTHYSAACLGAADFEVVYFKK